MSVVKKPLENWSIVAKGCRQRIFTQCRKKHSGELERLSVGGSPTAGVPVVFLDADGEVRFPEIRVIESGNLRAVLQNCWENGRGSGGYYSLLHHAEVLEVRGNLQALQDLLAYANGRYDPGKRWQLQKLPRGIRVMV